MTTERFDALFSANAGVLVVAELSANHHQSLNEALRLVDAADASGADAIKLQTYTADTLTLDHRTAPFLVKGTIWDGKNLHDLYAEAHTPWEWHGPLFARARELGMGYFSSPFDPTAVDFLETLGVPIYKIASFELVDIGLIERVAATGKPVIMSTGMADEAEIGEAIAAFRGAGGKELALLKCTSAYPSGARDANLNAMVAMRETFGVPVGLSDHSMELAVPVAAVALGARIIEKHITLDRSVPGPDSAFSLEPAEFGAMVAAVRAAERSLGSASIGPAENERPQRLYRRSLFVARKVRAGEEFTSENVRSVRPGNGLHTRFLRDVIGTRAATDVGAGTPLAPEHLDSSLRERVGELR